MPAFSRGFLVLLLSVACSQEKSEQAITSSDSRVSAIKSPYFAESAAQLGVDFHHFSAASSEHYFPEIFGAGVALLDYDSDGDLDVYYIQSAVIDPKLPMELYIHTPHDESVPRNRLYKNLLLEDGELAFVDVTQESGLGDIKFGMGVATADYDNDGDIDIYVSNYGANVLFENTGGQFKDVTASAGINDTAWSASASFADINNDGYVDLYVTNYVAYDISTAKPCDNGVGQRDYCAPIGYEASTDVLYLNNRDGTFVDISRESSIDSVAGAGLGVIAHDVDRDGFTDFIVANDQSANFLWRNLGNSRFEESGLLAGIAYNADGRAEASMGIAVGDFDEDNDDDVLITHMVAETNTLYENAGTLHFRDSTARSGMAAVSLRETGFGTHWLDVENDGDLDLFVANGAVAILENRVGKTPYPYDSHNQLFLNTEGGFSDHSQQAGFKKQPLAVARGSAIGDIDQDGDLDVVVNNNSGPAAVFINLVGQNNPALSVELIATSSNKDAAGAQLTLHFKDKTQMRRNLQIDGSYASSNARAVHFGFPPNKTPIRLTVRWPGGITESFSVEAGQQILRLTEASGQVDSASNPSH